MVRVIDVPAATDGRVLKVLMNADLDEAVAVLADPTRNRSRPTRRDAVRTSAARETSTGAGGCAWPRRSPRTSDADERFGVAALYVFGSTKNATAGPGSDIDLLVHFAGDRNQLYQLECWFEGWSQALAEMNYLRTGYRDRRPAPPSPSSPRPPPSSDRRSPRWLSSAGRRGSKRTRASSGPS